MESTVDGGVRPRFRDADAANSVVGEQNRSIFRVAAFKSATGRLSTVLEGTTPDGTSDKNLAP